MRDLELSFAGAGNKEAGEYPVYFPKNRTKIRKPLVESIKEPFIPAILTLALCQRRTGC